MQPVASISDHNRYHRRNTER